MKPEDLKSPFSWKNRHVLLQDRVLYIPSYYDKYDEFKFPGWEHPDFFGNSNPVHVEYCSGNGAWIAAKAQENPTINFVAIEKRFDRTRKIWSKIKNHQLSNLFAICGEGLTTTKRYFPSDTFSHAYINFPDPWPKLRHAKHRLIQADFVQEVWRILKENSAFTLVTDDQDYSKIMIEEMTSHSGFRSQFEMPHFVTEFAGYGTSFFEELWRQKGKVIHYHQFNKI